jgi:chemotaxis protein methyltransferase CheR
MAGLNPNQRKQTMNDFGVLDHKTFRKFSELVYRKAGITLGPNKEALVQARVGKRMRALGIDSFRDYLNKVESDETGAEVTLLLDAISTNVTHFFREPRHFDLLNQLLRKWQDEGQDKFRVWCAASSTGEEPYTIAMTAREALGPRCDFKLLATDISTKVLTEAREGLYTERDVEKIPRPLQHKYFRVETTVQGKMYRIIDDVRRMVTFARLNLSVTPYPMKGPFDIIFCRNVMIYFDNKLRKRLLDNCYGLVRHGGYLMVGHAESLSGMLSHFKAIEPAVYIRP